MLSAAQIRSAPPPLQVVRIPLRIRCLDVGEPLSRWSLYENGDVGLRYSLFRTIRTMLAIPMFHERITKRVRGTVSSKPTPEAELHSFAVNIGSLDNILNARPRSIRTAFNGLERPTASVPRRYDVEQFLRRPLKRNAEAVRKDRLPHKPHDIADYWRFETAPDPSSESLDDSIWRLSEVTIHLQQPMAWDELPQGETRVATYSLCTYSLHATNIA